VNPDHLFLGTGEDNMRDRDSKGRQTQGEKHHDAKLTVEQVKEIRLRYTSGSKKNGIRPLAREFGICKSAMTSVVKFKTWKGVL
jgi:hypothetical protein